MDEMTLQMVISVTSLLFSGGILLSMTRLVRHLTRIEFKVEEMWEEYKNTIGPIVQRQSVRKEIKERRRREN